MDLVFVGQKLTTLTSLPARPQAPVVGLAHNLVSDSKKTYLYQANVFTLGESSQFSVLPPPAKCPQVSIVCATGSECSVCQLHGNSMQPAATFGLTVHVCLLVGERQGSSWRE